MTVIKQLRFFLFLFVVKIIYVESLTSIRMAHIRILQQSVYSHGFHRHFLGKFSSKSMRDCLWMCHNNEYCRTATYRAAEQQCYLYEEPSYVGTISSTTDDSTVLAFDLCPSDTANQEPASVCFGSERKSVPMQTVMNGLQLIKSYSGITPAGFVLSTGEGWMPVADSYQINIYSFNDYTITRSISTNEAFGYFDFNSQMQFPVSYDNHGMYLSWLNHTYNANWNFWTPCFSITGAVVVPGRYTNVIYVYNQTTGAIAYSITGSMDLSSNYHKLACTVYDQTLYVASNNAIQKVSIAPPGGTRTFTSIFNFTTDNPAFITTDASKRLYSSCIDCTASNKTYILTTEGTLLAQWPQQVAFAQGKASKYKYYFVTSTRDNILSFYEY